MVWAAQMTPQQNKMRTLKLQFAWRGPCKGASPNMRCLRFRLFSASAEVSICVVWATQIALESIRSAPLQTFNGNLYGVGQTDRSSDFCFVDYVCGRICQSIICMVWAKQMALQHMRCKNSRWTLMLAFVWCEPHRLRFVGKCEH